MSIVVTGAGGQLGRLVVEALLARGVAPAEIVATSRDTGKLADLVSKGVVVRAADFSDPAGLPTAFAGADRLLLVSTDAVGSRLSNHRNAIDAATAAGVGLVVYTSAPYAETTQMKLATEHRETERYLRASGIPFVFLRNSWYFENYLRQLPTIREHHTILGSAGDGRVSAAARADYAEAAAVVLSTDGHAGQVYELGGDTAFTLTELAAALSGALGEEITYTDVPVEQLASVLVDAGVPAEVADVVSEADVALGRGDLYTDSGDLKRLIGRPTTTLADAVAAGVG